MAAIFAGIFAAVLAAHTTLLRLPYYWDEGGYYIPAAFDFFRSGAIIPYSTLSNAHPPLPSIVLALCWKLFGFQPWVTRVCVAAVSAVALTAVWRLALATTAQRAVAWCTVLLTALYPVWFAQSTLAHADIFAAAATLWALAFVFEESWRPAVVCFALAALAKETAIVTPIALAGWLAFAERRPRPAAMLLIPLAPLTAWYCYHWRRTGFLFGNPEFLRYNATGTLTPLRLLLAFAHRVLHLTAHMNLFMPVLLMLACMLLPAIDGRQRVSLRDQKRVYVILAANASVFSVLGGALLTRYLLPLYPLVLLLAVNTFRRRYARWPQLVALSAVAFLAGLFINPPYRFAPEDNLAYADVIRLHKKAITTLQQQYPGSLVLTAWPASDELTKPELGYVNAPMQVIAIDNFSAQQLERAAALDAPYNVALLFSTKYDPPWLPLSLGARNEAHDRRFFDFHRDMPPTAAARLLGGQVVWRAEQKGMWAALLHFNRPLEASATPGPLSPR